MANGADRARLVFDDEPRQTVFDHFGDGTTIKSNHRRATCHCFDHTKPNGSGQSIGTISATAAQEFRLLRVRDFADEVDLRFTEERENCFDEIILVGSIDLAAILRPQRKQYERRDQPVFQVICGLETQSKRVLSAPP